MYGRSHAGGATARRVVERSEPGTAVLAVEFADRADSGALVNLVISEKPPEKGQSAATLSSGPTAIDQVLNLAHDQEERSGTAYLGMSFEQGVAQGIEWTCGLGDGAPPLP